MKIKIISGIICITLLMHATFAINFKEGDVWVGKQIHVFSFKTGSPNVEINTIFKTDFGHVFYKNQNGEEYSEGKFWFFLRCEKIN